MMKIRLHKLTPKDKLEKHIFHTGQLIYEKSGHTLTFSNGYFICSRKCKKLCNDKTELSIKYRNLEKKFAYLLPNFKISEPVAKDMFYELDKIGVDLRKDIEKEVKFGMQTMDATLVCIKQSLAKNGKIKPSDTKTLKEEYYKLFKIGFPYRLMTISQEILKLLSTLGEENILSQKAVASIIIKNIYLTNDGKISKIRLEKWPDFLFQLIKHKSPDYLDDIKDKIIDRIDFDFLDFNHAIEFFSKDGYKNTFSFGEFGSICSKDQLFKDIEKRIKGGSSEQYFNFWYNVRDGIWEFPESSTFSDIYIYDPGI